MNVDLLASKPIAASSFDPDRPLILFILAHHTDDSFLLNAVTGNECTQAIITLNLAREAGVERIVYLSVFDADRAVNVPHLAVKAPKPKGQRRPLRNGRY
jgi:uncharacterized protein YbjT (DUF2867 family)